MVSISDTKITMVRGDTALITISITDSDGEAYEVQDGDVIRFAVKKRYSDDDTVILKTIDNDTLLLQIDPEDTEDLDMGSRGKYVYDIEITQADGTVDTFIRGTLYLLEEVE